MSRISFEAVQAGLADGSLRRFFSNVVIRNDVVAPGVPKIVVQQVEGYKAYFKGSAGTTPFLYAFGDGSTNAPASGRDAEHTYADDGDYDVTATDGAAAVTDEISVTVPANWQLPSSSPSPVTATGDYRPGGDIEITIASLPSDAWVAQYYGGTPHGLKVSLHRPGVYADDAPSWFDVFVDLPATGPVVINEQIRTDAPLEMLEVLLSLYNPVTENHDLWQRGPQIMIVAAPPAEPEVLKAPIAAPPARKPRS